MRTEKYKDPQFWKQRYCNNCQKFTKHRLFYRKGEQKVLDNRICTVCGEES